ncbi:hypothetical protein ABMY44_15535 [Pseudoalteromonas sp. Cnat2-41]|uniref:hypothetical protein n=1 Tax=Pseudoalteromonas TaxID=53246 RepID=UPI0012453F3E|nr:MULTISPECIES: hypothetical protein [Pseudoalteromonas]MCF2863745.1 hypothetical protein [Pseudoalteromonas sp. CNAT2-18]MCG7559505.1 hypothetical protein [Pseudoalteromonas sp. CNAT2-18.1]
MSIKPLAISFIAFIGLNLTACGSGTKNDEPKQLTPTPTGNIVDNSAVADYRLVIYGNSHSSQLGSIIETLISDQLPNKTIETVTISGRFLDEIAAVTANVEQLEKSTWSHAIFQGQKYSQSGATDYPTHATERLIAKAKSNNITPILFPEHPQRGDPSEAERVYNLHQSISQQELSCVAPVGLVWNRVLDVMPTVELHHADGNHASYAGKVLTAMTFYEIITGELADAIPYNPALQLDQQQQALFGQIVTQVLLEHPACPQS